MNKFLFSILFLSVLAIPFGVNSAIIQNSSDLNIGQQENFEENVYLFSTKSNIQSSFTEDLFLIGFENNFSGNVQGDLFIFGGRNLISGNVEGDLRIIGGEVVVTSRVVGDLLVLGGNVFLDEDAEILGETILFGGKIYQNTPLNQDLKIIAATVYLNDEINGQSEITAQKIVAENNTKITGVLNYFSPNRMEERPGSQISSIVNYNQIENLRDNSLIEKTLINLLNFWILLKFVTTLLIAFILVFVFRVFSQKVVDLSMSSSAKSVFAGFLTIVLAPVITVLLMISLIGLPIGLLLLLIYIILIPVSVAMASIIVGSLVRKLFSKTDYFKIDFQSAALGVIILTFITFVPIVGDLTKVAFNLIALGAVVRILKIYIFKPKI